MTTRQTLVLLRDYESRNVTFIEPDGSWPIVWERANGAHVWDADGKKYLDLTAAFGVAATGHANPRVVRAGQRQMPRLLHAMGDVHPHALKARLARELSRITFERWQGKCDGRRSGKGAQPSGCRGLESGPSTLKSNRPPYFPSSCSLKAALLSGGLDPALQAGSDPPRPTSEASGTGVAGLRGKTIFCNSGFEAVEAALKTAMLGTGKPGVIAFEGAYHGLGYGALNVTQRAHFRSPFRRQLREFARFVPFPELGQASRLARTSVATTALKTLEPHIRRLFRRERIGAVLVEPIQVRGGMRTPPPGFLPLLRRLCDEHKALLILDEIYTGFGRTGRWFACEHSATVPDLICLGKALTGGFPMSACVGRADLMDAAWPPSNGEAIHTSTFLGHPVGCAMALAQIRELKARALVRRSAELGELLLSSLAALAPHPSGLQLAPRGLGLLAGLEVRLPSGSPATAAVIHVVKALLRRGFILLPEGEHSNVIGFTPPLTISANQLCAAVDALGEELQCYKVP
jgi:4-aminobutyrate aminotransferase-like enzyme